MAVIARDAPFLDFLIGHVARQGFREIVLLAGYMGEVVTARYDGCTCKDARLRVVVEPTPAGTAGALRFADGLDETFLLLNGDCFLQGRYDRLFEALTPVDVGAIALTYAEDSGRFGSVVCTGGRVTEFREKCAHAEGPALISAGAYALRRDILRRITEIPCSIERDVFPALASEGQLGGVFYDGYFIDIGLPETLKEARKTVPSFFPTAPKIGGQE